MGRTTGPIGVPEQFEDLLLSQGRPLRAGIERHAGPVEPYLHLHEGIEMAILLEGSLDVGIGDASLLARPGDVWLSGMWELHWHGTTPPVRRSAEVVWTLFLPEFVGDEMLDGRTWLSLLSLPAALRTGSGSPEMRRQILSIGRELRREVRATQPAWETVVRADLLRVFALLIRHRRPSGHDTVGRPVAPAVLAAITPALRMVQARPVRRVGAGEAAAACGFSRTRFDVLFRQAIGVSFGRFCQRARLGFVASELRHTGQSLEQIADKAGFTDRSHLHHAFTKAYGCTPLEYRRLGSGTPLQVRERAGLSR
ncbi:MAG: helix-turn-helix domain-containing protein [Armatimonadota bacterium]